MKQLLKASILLTMLWSFQASAEDQENPRDIMTVPSGTPIFFMSGWDAPILTKAAEKIFAEILPYTEEYTEVHITRTQQNFTDMPGLFHANLEVTGYLSNPETGIADLPLNADGPCHIRFMGDNIWWPNQYTVQISGAATCPTLNRWSDNPMSVDLKKISDRQVEFSEVY